MRRPVLMRRARDIAVQAALLAALAALVAGLTLSARENVLGQGMATGFGFLERTTGWPVNFSVIEVGPRSTYARVLLAGLLNTLLVGGLALLLATALGTAVGLARVSSNLVLSLVGTAYVEVFRNVPMILQAFFWYAILVNLPGPREAHVIGGAVVLSNRGLALPALALGPGELALLAAAGVLLALALARLPLVLAGRALLWLALMAGAVLALMLAGREPGAPLLELPELQGLRIAGGLAIKPEFAALLIGLTLFGGAYVGEIVRGGILSVDRGRLEAARALGLSGWRAERLVRLPLALRAMLPALAGQYVWLMKATTVGIAIGYPDYFAVVSTSINQSGQTLELLALLMAGFLLVNYSIAGAMNALDRRLRLKGDA